VEHAEYFDYNLFQLVLKEMFTPVDWKH